MLIWCLRAYSLDDTHDRQTDVCYDQGYKEGKRRRTSKDKQDDRHIDTVVVWSSGNSMIVR